MNDELPYSSPLAYLNRFFRGHKKFHMSENGYENDEFTLTHLEGEVFELAELIREPLGPVEKEIEVGHLIKLVETIRRSYEQWGA
jgi:hypothetical protein